MGGVLGCVVCFGISTVRLVGRRAEVARQYKCGEACRFVGWEVRWSGIVDELGSVAKG